MRKLKIIATLSLFFLTGIFTIPELQAWVPDVGPGKCVGNCGGDEEGGGYIPGSPVPTGPSPEELRRQREEKDLLEAADDANNKGIEFYNKGDWGNAIKYFMEALEYSPDNQDYLNNLKHAQLKASEAEARRRQEETERRKQFELKSRAIEEAQSNLYHTQQGTPGAVFDTPAETRAAENNAGRFRAVSVQPGVANPAQLRGELMEPLSDAVRQRTVRPNEQAQEIMRSFKTGEAPSPIKNIAALAPGDVILVAPVPIYEIRQHFKDVIISNGINLLDRWGSDNWSSPASHAAIFLGERNGKRWYLDNTSSHGPVIREEREFLKEYGRRKMDVATLVGQPLSQHEGQELWKGAHELRKSTTYGIWSDDRMVCSETSRWLLVRAGRAVPETQSRDKNYDLIVDNLNLNKKQFVDFSPSDFYETQQYFVIHELGMKKAVKKKP